MSTCLHTLQHFLQAFLETHPQIARMNERTSVLLDFPEFPPGAGGAPGEGAHIKFHLLSQPGVSSSGGTRWQHILLASSSDSLGVPSQVCVFCLVNDLSACCILFCIHFGCPDCRYQKSLMHCLIRFLGNEIQQRPGVPAQQCCQHIQINITQELGCDSLGTAACLQSGLQGLCRQSSNQARYFGMTLACLVVEASDC